MGSSLRGRPPPSSWAWQLTLLSKPMRRVPLSILAMLSPVLLLLLAGAALAQPPGEGSFDQLDRNKDGKLSREELPEPLRGRFDQVAPRSVEDVK